jgi:plastocyanin
MANHNVNIDNMAFAPPEVKVSVGDTVTWTNLDAAGHSACRDKSPAFDTGLLSKGDTSPPIAFQTIGSFDYFCRQHHSMTAKVVVS